MRARCWLLSLALVLGAAIPAQAQNVVLSEAPLEGACVRNELTLKLTGKITVRQDGKPHSFVHAAQARHVFLERVLQARGGVADKAARHYLSAEGSITSDGTTSKRALRSERAFMVAHRLKDQLVVYSPLGALTRSELELTEHLDTLAVPGLVPGKEVAVGDRWKLSNEAAQLLCDLDGLSEHDLTCKLDAVEGGRARVRFSGSVSGIDLGAQVKILVAGHYDFDLKAKRLVALEWRQSDQRDQSPVCPALSADVTVKLTRTPIEEPAELNKFALVKVPSEPTPPASLTNVLYRDAKGRFELRHARDWHVVSPEEGEQLVLRLMNRGEFVAQVTVTPWKQAEPTAIMKLAEFEAEMAKTPGWSEDVQHESKDVAAQGAEKGLRHLYRVTATGKLDEKETWQAFHLLVGPRGQQVVVTFSALPTQVRNLGDRDLLLLRGVSFP